MESIFLECDKHGKQTWGIVCQHLLTTEFPLGFHEFEIEDQGRPDAWCDTCNENWKFTKNNEDREHWEENCGFKILCANCWDNRKALHTKELHYNFTPLSFQEI